MARYWAYLNDQVAGPFAVDQLIRLKGFSRQTLVCEDDSSGEPKQWISMGQIPELAHIFKAADERHAEPVPTAKPKPAPKPTPVRSARPFVPAVILRGPRFSLANRMGWLLLAAILAGSGAVGGTLYRRKALQVRERHAARALVENARLPPTSLYGSLPQYFEAKGIQPEWRLEKMDDALYRVTLSWYAPPLTVYAFEANTQAQTIRGLNSAAATLLSVGFPAPASAKPKAAPAVKKSPSATFQPAVDSYMEALESGNAQALWGMFSRRKVTEMTRAGISREGYARVQGLTHRVEASKKREVVKTKSVSDTEMLVLSKESQDGQPDVFVKQQWVYEEENWKLDDEQKKSDAARPTPTPPVPTALPGMSN